MTTDLAKAETKKKSVGFSSLSYKKQKTIISVLFLLVPVGLVLLFTYYPAVSMLFYSFTKWDGMGDAKFIGLDNYAKILSTPDYWKPLTVSIYYFVASFLQIGAAVGIAYLLSFGCKGADLFKSVYFFPSLINSVAIGFMFLIVLTPKTGTLDQILNMIGLGSLIKPWLEDPDIVNISLAGVSMWRYIGNNIVMFAAAMASISPDILEAARVDGANRWQQLKSIVIPGISTILGLQLFLAITGSLSAFEIPYIITGGSNGSTTFLIKIVKDGINNGRVGLGSAMSIVLLVICIVVTVIQKLVFREDKN